MIEFICPGCSKKLRVQDHDAGRKSQCPRCHGRIVVPDPQPEGLLVIQPPADENDMYDLMEEGAYMALLKTNPSSRRMAPHDGLMMIQPPSNENDMYDLTPFEARPEPRKCTSCGVKVKEETVVCVECGFDFRSGEKLSQQFEGITWAATNKLRLIKGTMASIVFGAIGAFTWVLIANFLEREYVWLAWIVGLICGYPMDKVARAKHYVAGLIAGIVALVNIVAAKYFVFQSFVSRVVEAIGPDEINLAGLSFWNAFGVMDGVFAILAFATAFKVAKGKTENSK